jgi:hypothetical protein
MGFIVPDADRADGCQLITLSSNPVVGAASE